MLFFYSTQTVSTSQTSELLHFLKNRVGRSISLLYTFGEFLAKSLKITHLNLLLITEKTFEWTWLLEPRLWSSLTIHWIIEWKSIHILVYLLLQGKRSWICFDARTFYADTTLRWECGHSFHHWKLWKDVLIKRKTNNFDAKSPPMFTFL